MLLRKQRDLHSGAYCKFNSSITPQSPVCILDPSEDLAAASILNPEDCWGPGPALSDGRGWTSELRLKKNSWSLTNCSSTVWIKKREWREKLFRIQSDVSTSHSLLSRANQLLLCLLYFSLSQLLSHTSWSVPPVSLKCKQQSSDFSVRIKPSHLNTSVWAHSHSLLSHGPHCSPHELH